MTSIKIHSGVMLQKVAEEMVLLEPTTGNYFTLNEIGAIIVEFAQSGRSIDDIVEALCSEFDVAEKVARDDVHKLLAQLVEQGLAEES